MRGNMMRPKRMLAYLGGPLLLAGVVLGAPAANARGLTAPLSDTITFQATETVMGTHTMVSTRFSDFCELTEADTGQVTRCSVSGFGTLGPLRKSILQYLKVSPAQLFADGPITFFLGAPNAKRCAVGMGKEDDPGDLNGGVVTVGVTVTEDMFTGFNQIAIAGTVTVYDGTNVKPCG